MDTRLWGPHFWETLQTVAFNYPEQPTAAEQQAHHQFYTSIARVLPCDSCRGHFAKVLARKPLDPALQNRETLSRWIVDVHNDVNQRLGKPVMAYDFVKEKYDDMRGTCVLGDRPGQGSSTCACPDKQSGKGLPTGWIVVIVLGSLGLVAGLVCFLLHRRHHWAQKGLTTRRSG